MKLNIKKLFAITLVILSVLVFFACEEEPVNGSEEESLETAKYVFLFIGNGMAMPQISATEIYLAKDGSIIEVSQLEFTKFPSQRFTTT